MALVVLLYLEAFDSTLPVSPAGARRALPAYRHYGWLEYGSRVGIFRILELFDRYDLRVTVAANGLACEAYSPLVEDLAARGYEFAAHGRAVNRPAADAGTADGELAEMRAAIAAVAAHTRRPVRGWISQDFLQSPHTMALAGGLGLDYVADFASADAPFLTEGGQGVVGFPNAYELDDVRLLHDRRVNAWDYPDMLLESFTRLLGEPAGPSVMCLPVHPWVLGMPHRFRYLAEALSRLASTGGYWNATIGEVVDWYRDAGHAALLKPLRFA